MSAQPPPMLNTKQCLEREAECRYMCTLASLTHVRRAELELMADSWARLAVITHGGSSLRVVNFRPAPGKGDRGC